MSDLSRAMKSHLTMDWMAISSYGSGTKSSGVVRILKDLTTDISGLASFPGFAELKRSLRERPQLLGFGWRPDEGSVEEDWHGGSRRQKK